MPETGAFLSDDPLSALIHAVPISTAQMLLGGKARSEIYRVAGDGLLDLVKDGGKTLVTIESIRRYQTGWKPIAIKPLVRRSTTRRSRKIESGAAA